MNQIDTLDQITMEPILGEVIHRTPVPMLALDSHEAIIQINQTACDILGYAKETCIGRYYMELLVLTQRPSFMDKAIKHGEVADLFNRDGCFLKSAALLNIQWRVAA